MVRYLWPAHERVRGRQSPFDGEVITSTVSTPKNLWRWGQHEGLVSLKKVSAE